MRFLIDGYNLLFAMGVLGKRTGSAVLEHARQRLLGLLAGAHGNAAVHVTVVFDAARPPPGLAAEHVYKGIHVVFAVEQEQADDLIEQLIRQASAPKNLTVVSDDHRLRDAAQRRRCVVLGCGEYLDWLDRQRRPRRAPEQPAKPENVSQSETERWLREFADLEQDPSWKELSDPPEFLEGDG